MTEKLSLEYKAGLFDGEGTFGVSIAPKKGTYLGFVAAPSVGIVVGHANNILYSFKEMFGGSVCLKTKVPCWRLFRRDGCINFAKTFYPYLIIRKDHCAIFLNILNKLNEGIQYTREGILWVAKEAEKLTHNTPRRKWTYERVRDAMAKNKCLRLKGPRSTRAVPWTNKEDDFLRENYKKFTDKELSSKMNRSRYGIKCRRHRLRLFTLRHRWREKYFNPFGRNYLMVCVKCGREIGRSDIRHGGSGPCPESKIPKAMGKGRGEDLKHV